MASGANLAPRIKRFVAPAAAIDDSFVGQKLGVIGGVAEEQIGRNVDFVAHRSAKQLAQPQARGPADRVKAGELDGGITALAALDAELPIAAPIGRRELAA
jgi:hypothetical protein